MKISEVLEVLNSLPGGLLVWLSSDEEGNRYHSVTRDSFSVDDGVVTLYPMDERDDDSEERETLTVEELIAELEECDHEFDLVLSCDSEGNHYHELDSESFEDDDTELNIYPGEEVEE